MKINIRPKLAGRAKDLLFWIDLGAGPGVAFGSFENAGRRVYGGEKLAQLGHAPGFFDFEQKFRLALQIVVTQAAVGGGPGKFQGLVVSPEFNRKISFHASARVEVQVEGLRSCAAGGAKLTVGTWRDPSDAAK